MIFSARHCVRVQTTDGQEQSLNPSISLEAQIKAISLGKEIKREGQMSNTSRNEKIVRF